VTEGSEIRVGVSACLMGDEVRFDGGHKRNAWLRDVLGPFVSYLKVCPEVGIGLGIPRETLRLERADGELRMVAPKSGSDRTRAMRRYAKARVRALRKEDLSGFVLKKDSPSCGVFRVRVYEGEGPPRKDGRGLFAEALMEGMPLLPVEEEGRLNDPRLRENFIERVFAYRRLKDLFSSRWSRGALVRFHSREKMLLLAHDASTYRELGRLVARAKEVERAEMRELYCRRFMEGMQRIATTRKHTNVLQHMAGHLKKLADSEDRQELARVIEDYRKGLVPLIVPVTLLRHHLRVHRVTYLEDQSYLRPHPKEMMLRNHV
jgi:uncharacterized protein YbgA (DUF1722 family)/uncharacterized protein YbbK (DUF523 family)